MAFNTLLENLKSEQVKGGEAHVKGISEDLQEQYLQLTKDVIEKIEYPANKAGKKARDIYPFIWNEAANEY